MVYHQTKTRASDLAVSAPRAVQYFFSILHGIWYGEITTTDLPFILKYPTTS